MAGTPRRKPGRMRTHIEPFREWLVAAGYTPGSVRGLLMVMGQLGRWMDQQPVGQRLTEDDLARFQDYLRSRSARRVQRLRSTDPLSSYLHDAGMLETPAAAPITPVDDVIGKFRVWMITERGPDRRREHHVFLLGGSTLLRPVQRAYNTTGSHQVQRAPTNLGWNRTETTSEQV